MQSGNEIREKFKPGMQVVYAGSAFEIAEVKDFPHGSMIGIYDEPPSKHIDYINPSNLLTLEDFIEEAQQLKRWKREALEVMPPFSKIGELLGVRLGETVHDKIVPGIEALKHELMVTKASERFNSEYARSYEMSRRDICGQAEMVICHLYSFIEHNCPTKNPCMEEARQLFERLRERMKESKPPFLQEGGDFYNGIEWLACYLLDHHEGQVVMEEVLRQWAVDAWHEHLNRAT